MIEHPKPVVGKGTPIVGFRIDLALWDRFRELADEEGVSRGRLLRDFIRWYVGRTNVAPTRPDVR